MTRKENDENSKVLELGRRGFIVKGSSFERTNLATLSLCRKCTKKTQKTLCESVKPNKFVLGDKIALPSQYCPPQNLQQYDP